LLQKGVRFRQILANGPLALVKIGDGIEAHAIDTQVEPEVDRLENSLVNLGIVEVQIGLMLVKAMPIVGFRNRIPGPVGGLVVLEDDASLFVLLRVLRPDVEISMRMAGRAAACALKPGVRL